MVVVVFVFGFFFSIDMQNLKQEGELLQHQLKRKGEMLLVEKCKFSAFSKRKREEAPSMYILPPFLKPTVGGQRDCCCFLRNKKLLVLLSLHS